MSISISYGSSGGRAAGSRHPFHRKVQKLCKVRKLQKLGLNSLNWPTWLQPARSIYDIRDTQNRSQSLEAIANTI